MAKNIGATLSLNNGNFFTNMKSAINASNNLKNTLNGTTTGMKNFGSQSSTAGGIITSLASKATVAIGAFPISSITLKTHITNMVAVSRVLLPEL